jgi:predicted RNA-binding Zn-ribbon protein involved in translation (DUF1610 family)
MKNTNHCPKCNSEDIIRVKGQSKGYGAGSNIPTGATIFQAVRVTRYICGNCGFIESWIDSPEDVAKVKEEYGNK